MTPFLTRLIDEFRWDLAFEVVKQAVKAIWEAMSPGDRKYLQFRMTGKTPLKDEQIYLEAVKKLKSEAPDGPNLAVLMQRRLSALAATSPFATEYYRLMITGEADPTAKSQAKDDDRRAVAAMQTLKLHAEWDETTWQQHLTFMLADKAQIDGFYDKLKRGGAGVINLVTKFSDSIEAQTGMQAGSEWVLQQVQNWANRR